MFKATNGRVDRSPGVSPSLRQIRAERTWRPGAVEVYLEDQQLVIYPLEMVIFHGYFK